MDDTPPTLREWRDLYEVTTQVKNLAPWEWMSETDLFAVEDPDSGQLGFVSVMGQAGEHFAIAVYLGLEGLQGFMRLEQTAPDAFSPELVLSIPQLQASFEDRSLLDDDDRSVIKALGLKFRGRNAWPLFRSYRPGFQPWFLTGEEARVLTQALQQVLDVAPRFLEDTSVLYGDDKSSMLVRVAHPTDTGIAWQDVRRPAEASSIEEIVLQMDLDLLERLRTAPRRRMIIETDLFMLPTPIGEGEGRPYYPYMLLLVHGQSGFVLGFELLHAEQNIRDLWAKVPWQLALKLQEIGMVPTTIKTRKGLMATLLEGLTDDLGITLKQSKRLHMLDEAKRALLRSIG